MKQLQIRSKGPGDTEIVAQRLALQLQPSMTVALVGELGAGKTLFCRALAAELGIDPANVVSPTFTLCHHYAGRLPLLHLDWYRLSSDNEVYQLGWEEMLQAPAVKLVEWADRFSELLPDGTLQIAIQLPTSDSVDHDERKICLSVPRANDATDFLTKLYTTLTADTSLEVTVI